MPDEARLPTSRPQRYNSDLPGIELWWWPLEGVLGLIVDGEPIGAAQPCCAKHAAAIRAAVAKAEAESLKG